jgi:glycine/D-amino acid oxidase-like deaminating enzyme
VLPLVVLGAGTAGLAVAAHRALRERRYAVLERASDWSLFSARPTRGLDGRWSTNPVLSLALLDARLILRNKRPRQMLGAGLPLVGTFGVLFVLQDPPPANVALFGFLLSGYLGMTYAQFGVAWHGRHFDGLLARAVPARRIVRAQAVVFAGLCAAPLAFLLPLVGAFAPTLLVPIGAFFLYNLGVTAPLLLVLGVWARKALTLNESTFFNYQGASKHHFLAVVPVMFLPMGLVVALGLDTTLLVVAGVGALGIVTAPLWGRGIAALLRRQRHAMAAGFRETE